MAVAEIAEHWRCLRSILGWESWVLLLLSHPPTQLVCLVIAFFLRPKRRRWSHKSKLISLGYDVLQIYAIEICSNMSDPTNPSFDAWALCFAILLLLPQIFSFNCKCFLLLFCLLPFRYMVEKILILWKAFALTQCLSLHLSHLPLLSWKPFQ